MQDPLDLPGSLMAGHGRWNWGRLLWSRVIQVRRSNDVGGVRGARNVNAGRTVGSGNQWPCKTQWNHIVGCEGQVGPVVMSDSIVMHSVEGALAAPFDNDCMLVSRHPQNKPDR